MPDLIHPTAYIDSRVQLGDGVRVGAFAVIEGPSRIGSDCLIESHARMGDRNHVHPHAVLGGLPQDLGFQASTETWLDIGSDNIFREGVTVSRATKPGASTPMG